MDTYIWGLGMTEDEYYDMVARRRREEEEFAWRREELSRHLIDERNATLWAAYHGGFFDAYD